MLAALKAVEASPAADRIGYDVVINSDEEVGSLGVGGADRASRAGQARGADLRARGAARRDARRRAARQRQFRASSSTAARPMPGAIPEDGRNAMVAAADLALRLDGAEARRASAINPARIDGGAPNNVVPDLAVLRVNMRPRTPDDRGARRKR